MISDTPQDVEQNIRTRAYLLWEAEGHLNGRMDDYWYRADDRIRAEAQSAYPPLQSMGHHT